MAYRCVLIVFIAVPSAPVAEVVYTRDIRPLLTNHCVGCHSGPKPEARYDVSSYGALLESRADGTARIVPGEPDASPLLALVRGDQQPRMPLGEPPLAEADIELLRAWIAAGAPEGNEAAPSEAASPAMIPGNGALGDSPEVEALVAALAFSGDARDQLIQRRRLRLRYLPPPPEPPLALGETYNDIDAFIVAAWEQAGLQEAADTPPVCTDEVFVRRVYLDVVGRIPSADEARAFLADKSADKRERLIDDLLARNREYAAHWTPFWEDALCSNGSHQGGVGTRGNFRDWIYQSFESNKPFDVMAAELLDPTMPGHVERYVLNQDHKATTQSAANTAQVFLGTSLKCASCHNHFENKEWSQARFLSFAGFFGEKDLELIRCEQPTGQTIPTRFIFDLPGAPLDAPATQQARLRRVAQLLTDPTNPRFAKALVNRLWKRCLGLGLFEPADDFRLDRPPSHPELLEWLADDFMRHGYDIKHTLRLILASRTYQLAYNPELEDHYDVAKPTAPRYFRSPSLRRMTAEQFLDSVDLAVGSMTVGAARRAYQDDMSTALTRLLGRPATRNEVSTGRPDDVAVVQALELLNGEEYHRRIYRGARLRALAGEQDPAAIVEQAFWHAWSRPPDAAEREASTAYLREVMPAQVSPEPATREVVVVGDDAPAGAVLLGSSGAASWAWFEDGERQAMGGARIRLQESAGAPAQHFFELPGDLLHVGREDVLFADVYLDDASPPRALMLQWMAAEGGWGHRAYWGDESIPYGAGEYREARLYRGPLPAAGRWVRLEVPAREVGLAGKGLRGVSFDQSGGAVRWGAAGVVEERIDPRAVAVGDMFWALLTSPRFQYIP